MLLSGSSSSCCISPFVRNAMQYEANLLNFLHSDLSTYWFTFTEVACYLLDAWFPDVFFSRFIDVFIFRSPDVFFLLPDFQRFLSRFPDVFCPDFQMFFSSDLQVFFSSSRFPDVCPRPFIQESLYDHQHEDKDMNWLVNLCVILFQTIENLNS